MTEIRINTPNTKHLYSIGCGEKREECVIKVEANSRAQAAAIAKRAGYVVRDVNMIG